jgi:uncharacterized protein (TIGR00730 family)
MKSIVVFCGSSSGTEAAYTTDAIQLGKVFAENNIRLIYGGAQVGLMGAVADGVLNNGGQVTGVLPHFLSAKEIAHPNLTEMILVDTMHERKLKMNELADGVIALPGGFGTMEELFEMLTWGQLGLHPKPIGILDSNGFYQHLIGFIDTMVRQGFLKKINQDMLLVGNSAEELLEKMNNYQAPPVEKWITSQTT